MGQVCGAQIVEVAAGEGKDILQAGEEGTLAGDEWEAQKLE